jgi:hypothetical protein
MAESWKDVAAELAGPRATLRERPSPPDWGGKVVAEVELPKLLRLWPFATFQAAGADSESAWWRIAHDVAEYRLVETLKAAGWHSVEAVIDETTFVAARDPDGAWWAIGVAALDSDKRGYIERDIGLDDRSFDRIAFIEPLDTRDFGALLAALEANALLDGSDDRTGH